MEIIKIEKPNYTWHCSIPFSRAKRDYKKDRERYDDQFLSKTELIRKKQGIAINGVSALLILTITTLWTLLPPLVELPNWLAWTKMGMEGFGSKNWGNQIMLTIIPGITGWGIHNVPKLIPSKKGKFITNAIIKIIPVLILICSWYLVHTEKQIQKLKKELKNGSRTKIDTSIPDQSESQKTD